MALSPSNKVKSILVTEADRASERLILERIQTAYPDHAILSEENGASMRGASAQSSRLSMDCRPIGCTTNFVHGYPIFSVTMALQVDEVTELGITYDPLRDELFTARRGQGARLNDRVIHVSKTPVLDQSLLATGFPYDRRVNSDNKWCAAYHALDEVARCHPVRQRCVVWLQWPADGWMATGSIISRHGTLRRGIDVNEAGGCATNPAGDRLNKLGKKCGRQQRLDTREMLAALQAV